MKALDAEARARFSARFHQFGGWGQDELLKLTGKGALEDAAWEGNPAFTPRNHRVEALIGAAVEQGDFGPFEELLAVLSKPYEDQPDHARYAEAPEGGGVGYRTFCGT